jgi:hypothetical protein
MRGESYCYVHHPDYREQRRQAASKGGKRGGRGRGNADLREVKALLRELTGRVLDGEVPSGIGAVVNQLLNTRLRAVEVERRIREVEELEERLTRLEERYRKGERRWAG